MAPLTRTRSLYAAPVLLALLLSACGTPQEQCINRSTRELRSVQKLLGEVEGNLARGYAWEEYEETITRWTTCGGGSVTQKDGTVIALPSQPCLDDYTVTRRRQVAIDPAAETRKRDGLRAKLTELSKAAAPQVEACKIAYPEAPK
jgi:hypothetical protein